MPAGDGADALRRASVAEPLMPARIGPPSA